MRPYMRLPLLLLLFSIVLPGKSYAQIATPIDVFVTHDREAGTATLYFTNPVSGLSTPVTLPGFSRDKLVYEELTVTPNGVLFRNPIDEQVVVATPDGRVQPHPFIPVNTQGLFEVDWVLSPDRQSIGWVEVFLRDTGWESILYTADLAGTNIQRLPAPPISQFDPLRRIMPLALTDDRQVFYYDAAYRTQPRPLTEYFLNYQDVYVFNAATQQYTPLPDEPGCLCAAGVSANGQLYLRLLTGTSGFTLNLLDVRANASKTVAPLAPVFAQAGDVWFGSQYAYYTQAQNLSDPSAEGQFALMRVDLAAGQQQMLIGPTAQRWRALDVIDGGETLLLADIYGGGTYKFNLSDQTMQPVTDDFWLGTIYQN